MSKSIGILGGTSLMESQLFDDFEVIRVETEYGAVKLLKKGSIYFIQRHGDKPHLPPHKINYHANLKALKQVGVDEVISINSVGSLQAELTPGTFVVVDDYFSPWFIPTYFDQRAVHVAPRIDENLRQVLISQIKQFQFEFKGEGTYVHALGPRFETKAEIRWMAQVGEVVGMTAGGEIALANELNLPIALLTMVDNFANGISGVEVDYQSFKAQAKLNLERVETVLQAYLKL